MKLLKKRIVILGWILMTLIVTGISIAKAALPFTSVELWSSDVLWTKLVEDAKKDEGLWLDVRRSLWGNASTWIYSLVDDSPRFFIRWTGIAEWPYIVPIEYEEHELGSLSCRDMLYGYYYNPEFLEWRLLSLNEETKDTLENMNLNETWFITQDDLSIIWWFYTDCASSSGDIDTGAIYWIIKYTFDDWVEKKVLYLSAWIEIGQGWYTLKNELFLNKNLENSDPDMDRWDSWTSTLDWNFAFDDWDDQYVLGGFYGTLEDKEKPEIQVYGKFFDSVSNSDYRIKSSIKLVQFVDSLSENILNVWINWFNGAIWWWWLSENKDVSSLPREFTWVTKWYVNIELEAWMNGKYICAFWQIWDWEEEIICSEDMINISSVWFEVDVPSDWIASWEVVIKWTGENITKWWWLSESKNVSSVPGQYTWVNSSSVTIGLNRWMNGKYICAFLQKWELDPQIICSENKVKFDNINPTVELISPSNWSIFDYWDPIYFEWSGSDGELWISWYIVDIGNYHYEVSDTVIYNVNLPSWVYEWIVQAVDNAGNSVTATRTFEVSDSNPWHGSAQNYVQFERPVPSMWRKTWYVEISWYEGTTRKWWWLSDNNSTDQDIPSDYTAVNQNFETIDLTAWMRWKFICAFWDSWIVLRDPIIVCSTNRVKIDTESPALQLLTPTNGVEFNLWDRVTFRWSGSDNAAGISGYMINIYNPLWSETYSTDFWNNITSESYTVNIPGTWNWRVKACDRATNCVERSWSFVVLNSWSVDHTWWFYLIRPRLWEKINLWNDITFSWNPWSHNSGYVFRLSKIWEDEYVSYSTTNYSEVISGWFFGTWAYSWSVYDNASETIQEIPVFYIVDDNDNEPDLRVNEFEFYEEKHAELDEYYTSNRIIISWMTDGLYTLATLKDRRWSLWINWEFVWTQWYVTNWDSVYIEMKASNKRGETVTATLIVWTWSDAVYGSYKVTTDDDIGNPNNAYLSPLQKLWCVIFVDNLVEMYQYDEWKLATFLSTFMQVIEDKIYEYGGLIEDAELDWDDDLLDEYKLYKNALMFLYNVVEYRYNNIEVEERTVYIAPNWRQYIIEYDEDRMAYTSPDFSTKKYFPTWDSITAHINKNNSVVWSWGIVGNMITTHNGKVYLIYEKNGKWTSDDFGTAKYFDTKEDIINHILANNPASNWNHKLDTNFTHVKYTAPNGKTYTIFKTSSEWSNPDMYSSYDFVNAKYFTTLEAAKKFINQSNPKK